MTVSATTSRVSYSGNGSTVTFTVPFYFIYSTDLKVYKTSFANVQTLLVEGTDYTVTGAGVISGGSITCTTAPSSDYTIIIYRDPAATQLVDYQANDPFPAETHERALDKLTMLAQRLSDVNDRSIHLSDGDASNASTELSSPLANYLIGWNSTGDALHNVDPATLATVVAYATAHADTFTGDGTTTSWTLSANPGVLYNLDVSINGVTQVPVIDYTYSGTTFTTTTAAPLNAVILVKYKEGLPNYSGDSQDVRYLPSGGTATTVQDKLRETVSVFDFMPAEQVAYIQAGNTASQNGAVVTAAIQAARDYCVSSGAALVFPQGDYKYSVSPNFGVSNFQVIAQGRVRLYYTGTGNALIFDAGTTAGDLAYNVNFGNDNKFHVYAPSTSLNGVYVRSVHHSYIGVDVHGCGTSSSGLCVEFAVCTTFNVVVSGNEGGWYLSAKPYNGYLLDKRLSGETTSYCYFPNPIVEGVTIGINIKNTLGNNFYGGTSEGCSLYGVFVQTNGNNDKFFGTDFEENTTCDIYCQGSMTEFYSIDTASTIGINFGALSKACRLVGGNHRSILLDTDGTNSAAGCTVRDIIYNRPFGVTTTGAINSGSTSLTVAVGKQIANGDSITINGAGIAGANLTTSVISGGGSTSLTLATSASTTVSNANITTVSVGTFSDFGTGTEIANVRNGVSPYTQFLTGSVTISSSSVPYPGTAVEAITVSGAKFGDKFTVAGSVSLASFDVTAQVTSANTVSVHLTNITGLSATKPACTLKVSGVRGS